MSNTLSDTFETAKNVMESAQEGAGHAAGTAKHAFGSAREGAEHAASSVRATWWDGVKAVTGIITMLRSLQTDDALGWVGLARRRSPLVSMGLFGAGLAVGAGAGVLFAPMSGLAMRRRILGRLVGLEHDAVSGAKKIEEKAEDLASKTKDLAVEAAHKAIDSAAANGRHSA